MTSPASAPVPRRGSVARLGQHADGSSRGQLVSQPGGEATQLTWWGSKQTRVLGWRVGPSDSATRTDGNENNRTGDHEILVISSAGEDTLRDTWARAIRPDGSTVRLPFGPVSAIAAHPDGPTVLGSAWSREPAHWKRYRGGTAPQLWIDREGSGEFVRLLPELGAGLAAPTWIADRLVF